MRALYSLSRSIASFDFYSWLVMAKARGATEIVIDTANPRTSKWDLETVLRRISSIILPGPAFAGLRCSIGNEGGYFGEPNMSHLVQFCRDGHQFERLQAPQKRRGGPRYTVTLRRTARRPERNSNETAWRAFADEIGALIFEDFDVAPVPLKERMALYAGAEMNFGVTNGPMHLCSLTPYPMMMFACDKAAGAFANCGIGFGEQYPWASPDQRLVWEGDELSIMRRIFEEWRHCRRESCATA
jgi:hypothetical protein